MTKFLFLGCGLAAAENSSWTDLCQGAGFRQGDVSLFDKYISKEGMRGRRAMSLLSLMCF